MNCSPPGSLVHGILQARILEWVAIPFSRGSSWPRDWTQVSCIASRLFTILATKFDHNLSSSWYLVLSYALGPLKEKRWKMITPAEGTCHDNSCFSHLWHIHVDRALSQVLLYPNCLFRFPLNIYDLLLPICCSVPSMELKQRLTPW